MRALASTAARALANQFVRLLFKNSEEVKRIWFISDQVRLGMRLH